ncbi:MAG: YraN family protein [Gammaproteobacteria bacterium]|nr:MAG: YraN family protein [Gammaproteobacteria bacterium]
MIRPLPEHLEKGVKAEIAARHYLERAGYQFLRKNYRTPYGEVDLIMKNDDTLVFIEVRYRKNGRFGQAEETIGSRKQSKLLASAEHFLQQNSIGNLGCRFDIVAITGTLRDDNISWIRNAIQA